MKKQFKLKQRTPWTEPMGVGDIVIKQESGIYQSEKEYKSKYAWPFHFSWSKDNIENWPEFWEPVKEPIFVTTDRVEIFDETKLLYCANPHTFEANYFENDYAQAKHAKEFDNYVWFSTREARDKWIYENKPIYSKKQIFDAVNNCFHSNYIGNKNHGLIEYEQFRKFLGL